MAFLDSIRVKCKCKILKCVSQFAERDENKLRMCELD